MMNSNSMSGDKIRRDYEPGGDSNLYTVESRDGSEAVVAIGDDIVATYEGDGAWLKAQRHALGLLSDREIQADRSDL